MTNRRVLFVLKLRDGPYGDGYGWGGECGDKPLSSGLFNSARFVAEMLANNGIPTKLVHVKDGNQIHREVVAFNATDVVIEAFWCPPYKFDDLRRVLPKVRFIVRNHSDMPFLASEGMAIGWSLDYLTKPNVVLAPNSPRMLDDMRFIAATRRPDWSRAELLRRVPYLPNYYPTPCKPPPLHPDDGVLDVGCFGAIRPLKDQLSQAFAALMFAQRIGRYLRFHINGKRIEMNGGPVRKSLDALFRDQPNAELICHDWLDHDDFKRLVSMMDLVSCVSFSETFCIVAADAVSEGVPMVCSAQVPWSVRLSQADPTNCRSIEAAMLRAWRWRRSLRYYDPNLISLRRYAAASRRIWLAFLA